MKIKSIKFLTLVLLFAFAMGMFTAFIFDVSASNETCFCHNVNNNPHTICTSNQGQINGHTNHVNNGEDTQGECPVSTPTATPTSSPTSSPTVSPSGTPQATQTPVESFFPETTPTGTPIPEIVNACNHSCNNDSECQQIDKSYRCTPEHVCRLIEAPERNSCDPRPNNCTQDNPEGCAEEMREAGYEPQGPMK